MPKENEEVNDVSNDTSEVEETAEKVEETNGNDEEPENSQGEFIGDGEPDPIATEDKDDDAEGEDEEKDDEKDEDFGSKKKPKKKKPVKKAASSKGKKGAKGKKRPAKAAAEEEYEVQDIVSHREVKGRLEYKIRWKGWGPSGDTWEPVDTLSCPDILDKYNKKNKVESGKRKAGASPRGPPKKQKIELSDDEEGDPNAEYEVERLIDCREKRNGNREFLVHWKGWGKKFDSWEPEENLNCQDLIGKFLEKLEKVKGASSKGLRVVKKHTQRFTLQSHDKGRRLSKRNSGKQRAVYYDADD